MSDADSIDTGDRGDLAAEYVLGVLPVEERRLAELRLTSEPRFAPRLRSGSGALVDWRKKSLRSRRHPISGKASRIDCPPRLDLLPSGQASGKASPFGGPSRSRRQRSRQQVLSV